MTFMMGGAGMDSPQAAHPLAAAWLVSSFARTEDFNWILVRVVRRYLHVGILVVTPQIGPEGHIDGAGGPWLHRPTVVGLTIACRVYTRKDHRSDRKRSRSRVRNGQWQGF